mmetsp:Transcript_112725/g.313640  ORF Transcript_112725/g.313640 Transcript_112725/m.313640 type:complete len:244 (-) Transcript_112725:844-1575(-)
MKWRSLLRFWRKKAPSCTASTSLCWPPTICTTRHAPLHRSRALLVQRKCLRSVEVPHSCNAWSTLPFRLQRPKGAKRPVVQWPSTGALHCCRSSVASARGLKRLAAPSPLRPCGSWSKRSSTPPQWQRPESPRPGRRVASRGPSLLRTRAHGHHRLRRPKAPRLRQRPHATGRGYQRGAASSWQGAVPAGLPQVGLLWRRRSLMAGRYRLTALRPACRAGLRAPHWAPHKWPQRQPQPRNTST